MTGEIPAPARASLRRLGFDPRTLTADPLIGGMNAQTVRLRDSFGRSAILKTGVQGTIWQREADGLKALRVPGGPRTPEVYDVGETFILMEDMPLDVPDDGPFWELFAEQLAVLHQVHGRAFGYDADNFLGVMPQRNPWSSDGWSFFANHRLLRYLAEPLCQESLGAAERVGIERICERLRDLVPEQPPSFLHGDLWRMNIVGAADGTPGFIDPAPYYAWAEIDLSMLAGCGGVPERFFDVYSAIRPMSEGWRERLELLHLREHLSTVAHFGTQHPEALARIGATVRRFA